MRVNVIAGLLVGAFEGGLLVLLHLLDVLRSDMGMRLLMLTLFVHAAALVGVMVWLRVKEGQAGFARLLGAGLMTSLVAALSAASLTWLFLRGVDPTYLDWTLEQNRAQILEWEVPDEERAAALERLAATDAATYASSSATRYLVWGFFLSLLFAALLRLRILRGRPDERPSDDGASG